MRLLERLQRRGHRVLFFCRDEGIAERARALGVPAEVAHLGGHVGLHHALRFAGQLRRHRPDALVLGTFKKTWLGAAGARLARVPRVVARIGLATDLPGRGLFYRIAFGRWIDRVVVNAVELRTAVLASMPALDPSRVAVVWNGVEEPARARIAGALRADLGIPADAPVVGAVARLAAQKRLDLLLRVVARLDGVRCMLAGDGPEEAALRQTAEQLGLGDRVTFLGHREAVGDVLDALDLFAVTSRTEGMSNAMLEALAAGVPVVSTPVSGAAEALEPLSDGRRPGFVVESGEDALAATIGRVLADPRERERMAGAARERARARFAWEDKVSRWEELLLG